MSQYDQPSFYHHWRVQFGVKIKQLRVCTIPSSNDGFETLSTISKPWNEKKLLCGSLFGSISGEEAVGMFEIIDKTIFYIKITGNSNPLHQLQIGSQYWIW